MSALTRVRHSCIALAIEFPGSTANRPAEKEPVTLYALKPKFQARLRPAVARLAARGITANQVTVTAMAGSLAVPAASGLAVRTDGPQCH